MCRTQNKPPKFSKPRSQYDRAVVLMSSSDASEIIQYNLGIFDSFRLLTIMNGRGFTLCGISCLWFDLVMRQSLLQERVVSVFG